MHGERKYMRMGSLLAAGFWLLVSCHNVFTRLYFLFIAILNTKASITEY